MSICKLRPLYGWSDLCRLTICVDLSWKHVFPTSVMGVAGVSIMYVTTSTIMLASVPVNVKSLCGSMVCLSSPPSNLDHRD